MKTVLLIFGTRPEAIKMCPLVKELKSRPSSFKTIVCVTGQHREMLQQVLDVFNVVPDYDLDIMKKGQTLSDITIAINEGRDSHSIWVTGNTAIDALRITVRKDYTDDNLEWAKGRRLIIITAHRRENLGEPMHHMFKAIKRVLDEHDDVCAIYPIHMNPQVRKIADEVFGSEENRDPSIRIIEPLDVLDFHNYMAQCYMILTDSGGIQEEAPSLGKPVLVMRDTTERP